MRLSISLKLALILVVASVVPLATGVVLAYYDTAAMHRSFAGANVRECAVDAAHAVEAAFDSLLAPAKLLAADPGIIERLEECNGRPGGEMVRWSELAPDQEPLRTLLAGRISERARSLMVQNEAYLSVALFDSTCRPVGAAWRPAAASQWWQCPAPLSSPEPAVRIVREQPEGELAVSLVGRIQSPDGATLGSMRVLIDSRRIFRSAAGCLVHTPPGSPVAPAAGGVQQPDTAAGAAVGCGFAGRPGIGLDVVYGLDIMASASPERIGLRLGPGDLPELPSGMGWGIMKPDGGQPLLVSSTKVVLPGGAELVIVVREEMSRALAGMHRRLSLILIVGGCMIVVFFLMGLYVSHRHVTLPIRGLIRGARVLRGGDLSHRIEPHHPAGKADAANPAGDELGELANEFNNMAESIMETQSSLGQKVQQRTRQLAEENKKAVHAREQLETAMTKLRETQANLIQTEKLASLGLLVAGVAHEINNPLAFILNNLSVIERDYRLVMDLLLRYRKVRLEGPPAACELERIAQDEDELDIEYLDSSFNRLFSSTLNGLDRVKTIVHDLKDFSRLEEQEAETLNVEEAIDTTLELAGYHLVSAGIDVVRDYCGAPVMRCSPSRLNQVLLNLIMNAIQAMARGGTLTLSTAVEHDRVVIRVADTGCGITPEHLPKIFDPFFTTKKQGDGTGLGLSVSYGIIREHNGTIEVSSTPGKGSTFTVSLPLDGPGKTR